MSRCLGGVVWAVAFSACSQGSVEAPLRGRAEAKVEASSCRAWMPDASPKRIGDLQGQSHVSPRNGERVEGVSGIVTRREARGFFLQDAVPDGDDCTSDALFVYAAAAPSVAVGDRVQLSGRVNEYRQGCAACPASDRDFARLSVTQLLTPQSMMTLARRQTLPRAVLLGEDNPVTRAALEDDAHGDVEAAEVRFDPSEDALDFYESLEGMRVTLSAPRVVQPSRRSGEVLVVPAADAFAALNTRGALLANSRAKSVVPLWLVFDGAEGLDVGDRFNASLSGILSYADGAYRVLVDESAAVARGGLQRERLALGPASEHELSAATFNVHNLALSDAETKFSALAELLVEALGAPDLVALQEVQDDSGAKDDGTVAATATLTALCSAIKRAGGPSYEFTEIAPEDGNDGGAAGGNIRVAVLYRGDRGLALVQRGAANAMTVNTVVTEQGRAALRYSPGRIDPGAGAWQSSRKPLAAQFTFRGQSLFIVANHFSSKLGDQPTFGRFQPPERLTESKRVAQASAVADWVQALLREDERAHVMVLGDLNDVPESASLRVLEEAGLSSVLEQLPEEERYTYIFEGNAQTLDHILVSRTLSAALTGVDIVHTNAEFSASVSDHDPVLARFAFEP